MYFIEETCGAEAQMPLGIPAAPTGGLEFWSCPASASPDRQPGDAAW